MRYHRSVGALPALPDVEQSTLEYSSKTAPKKKFFAGDRGAIVILAGAGALAFLFLRKKK